MVGTDEQGFHSTTAAIFLKYDKFGVDVRIFLVLSSLDHNNCQQGTRLKIPCGRRFHFVRASDVSYGEYFKLFFILI